MDIYFNADIEYNLRIHSYIVYLYNISLIYPIAYCINRKHFTKLF